MAWVWPPNTPQEEKKKRLYKRPVYERDQLKVDQGIDIEYWIICLKTSGTTQILKTPKEYETTDIPENHRRHRLAPYRAEMQEYDFYNVNSNFTTMVAPFGTNHTPPMSYKIVGGHYVPVVERTLILIKMGAFDVS
ncbi:hypothetical protein KUTeg_016103 [Tegillarca granosa]|uniref:Uncharacterized protein n=1 Tax=Tegillarca granosa TaxID=220873 RepID=A0ABQ9EJW4_TEGGR|nr:hypothetical protein KUTeg_016103 [Tegillarca granosa]